MSKTLFSLPRFTDDNAAREHLESIRWPNGPVCPHCGGTERNSLLQGKAHRPGLYACGDCRSQFTVTVGTVFERSKIPLHKWVLATHLLCASKKGMSSKQIERMLDVTYKTAWFMTHRIRAAMTPTNETSPLGSGGGTVEADETYWGNKKAYGKGPRGWHHKMKVFTLVERNGKARSFHVPSVNSATLKPILNAQLAKDAHVVTDDAVVYRNAAKGFASHRAVNHSIGEYVRVDGAHTNTVEGYFSLLKRGLIGTFHHVGEQHLHRYVKEFDFRWNTRTHLGFNDEQRAAIALKGISGKRLTYRRIDATAKGLTRNTH
jgi:transposase-like protein